MYHYDDCGLPNIYLKNGFTITNHEEYGECYSIHNLEGLHKTIGLNIITHSTPLMSGTEFRYLRIELDLSQKALGDLLGTTDQTIANYEKGEPQPIADKFLRILYKESIGGNIKIMESLERLNQIDRKIMEYEQLVELEEGENGWAIAA